MLPHPEREVSVFAAVSAVLALLSSLGVGHMSGTVEFPVVRELVWGGRPTSDKMRRLAIHADGPPMTAGHDRLRSSERTCVSFQHPQYHPSQAGDLVLSPKVKFGLVCDGVYISIGDSSDEHATPRKRRQKKPVPVAYESPATKPAVRKL